MRGQLEGPLGDLGGLVELVAFETASFEARQSTQTTFRYAYL